MSESAVDRAPRTEDSTEGSTADPTADPTAAWTIFALAAAIVPFLALTWRFDFVCDDAYITFRYARNLVDGFGLVYNRGVLPPVEGYSEFLWALWIAAGFELGLQPETASRALSVAAGLGLVVLVSLQICRRYARTPIASVVGCLVLGAAPPLAVWSTGGMGTMLAAFLATSLFVLAHRPFQGGRSIARRGVVLGVVGSLLALSRADAALLVALILAPPIVIGIVRGNRPLARSALIGAAISAATFGAHVAWRVSVYDDWLPNTARAKLGFSAQAAGRGWDYVLSMFLSMPGLGVAFLGALAGAALGARRVGGAAALGLTVLVVGVTAYAIGTGGDFMAFGRFLVPAIPFAALGFAALLAWLEGRSRVAAAVLGAGAAALSSLAAFDLHVVPESTRLAFHFRHNQRLSGVALSTSELEQWRNMRDRAEQWGICGRALARHAPPESSVVYGAVGAIGYFSNLFVYDRNGLVTREVALREPHEQLRSPGHDKVVPPEYFLRHAPTYLDVGVWPASHFPPPAKAGRRLEVLGETERAGLLLWVEPGR